MKALKITLAILIPVAIIVGILPVVFPFVAPLEGMEEFDFGAFFESFFEIFKDLSSAIEYFKVAIYSMLACIIVGAVLFVAWIVFAIIKRKFIGILWGFVAAIVLTFTAFGVIINASFSLFAKTLDLESVGYDVMQYLGFAACALFIAAFVVHVLIMFKAAKARKAAKKAQEEQSGFDPNYEIDYNDLPPVLFEEHKADVEPELFLERTPHIPVSANRVLKGYYVRDDEIDALLSSGTYGAEEEIPESILEFLHSKTRAEERGEYLPIFDPNFVPSSAEEAMYTDEELRVIEALRNYKRETNKVEPVPESIRRFLEKEDVSETPDLPIFDPNFVPEVEKEEGLSSEEQRVVAAMAHYQPKVEDDYIDLPMFKEHEEPVEYVEEFVEFVEPEVEVDAPKLESKKPVHISKTKEGKYQLKQVGEESPLAVFETEEEAIGYAEALKKANGVAVRIHDDEGKIRSL